MDIHSAESHLDKVNQYLEDLVMNPKVYSKTKDKLRSLSNELFRGIDLISKILMEESLCSESGFDAPESEFKSAVKEFEIHSQEATERAEELKQFVSISDAVAQQSKDSYRRRTIVAKYGRTLSHVVDLSKGSPAIVSDCAKILNRWYVLRFFESPKHSNNFHYNVRQIREWIEAIVIAYGSYVATNNTEKFFQIINDWLNKLSSAPQSVPYALPVEIFEISRSSNSAYATHSAMCIWDMLFDLGLDALSDVDIEECRLSKFALCDRFSKINPDIVDSYTYYGSNIELLKQYKVV